MVIGVPLTSIVRSVEGTLVVSPLTMFCTSVWNVEGALLLVVVVAMAGVSGTTRKLRAARSCGPSPLARVSGMPVRLLDSMLKLSGPVTSDRAVLVGYGYLLANLAPAAMNVTTVRTNLLNLRLEVRHQAVEPGHFAMSLAPWAITLATQELGVVVAIATYIRDGVSDGPCFMADRSPIADAVAPGARRRSY